MLAYELLLCHGKYQFVLFDIKENQFSVMVRSILVILTQNVRKHDSAHHERDSVALLILSSLPLKRSENYTIHWNLTITHAIFQYLNAHSDKAVANGAYVTIHFLNTNYLYNNIPEFGTPCSEHPVYRHEPLTAYHNSYLFKFALIYMFRLS